MGEQSKDSETEEASTFRPFLRNPMPFPPPERLRMAEEIAMNRKLMISPLLRGLILHPENFFHSGQQSAKMAEDAHQRRYESFKKKREANIRQKVLNGLPLPSHLGMNEFIDINPTRVTLSLEFESQYYHLMTNEYGEHENLASIMAETNTLIQLPDQMSEGPVPDALVQQVSITGLYSDVERARTLMRENCHISVFMSLSEVKISNAELESIVHKNPNPNVEMQFCHTSFYSGNNQYHLRFTSRAKHKEQLIGVAETVLKKAFDGETQPANQFSIHFTISTFHVEHIIGRASTSFLMPQIESLTKTKISYPAFNSRDDFNENIVEVVIVGEVKNILEARKHIIELLPISICFNLKNTDLAAESDVIDRSKRRLHVNLDEQRLMMKVTPSMYEPTQLLADEVQMHCISLRTKEFNIRNLYASYQRMLADKVKVVAPQPDSCENSIWHRSLPRSFFRFPVQCRGERLDSVTVRRNRTSSVTSCKSKRSHSNRAKVSSESSTDPNVIPTTEHIGMPMMIQTFSPYGGQFLYMVKAPPNFPPQAVMVPNARYVAMGQHPDQLIFPIGHPISEVENGPGSSELALHSLPVQRMNDLRGTGRGNGPTQNQNPNLRPPRIYEQVKDEDARSSTRSASRRASVSVDEPSVGSFEDRGYDRPFSRQYQRFPKEEQGRWKSGNRGEKFSKRNSPQPKEIRIGSAGRDTDYHFGSFGSAESRDHLQFQMTHHLKLKQNDIDLDNERLFTHDTSLVEEQDFSPRSYDDNRMSEKAFKGSFSVAHPSFERGKRSRTPSAMDIDDLSSRFTDSEGGFSIMETPLTQQSRSIENYKKGNPGVTKTMLEPRCRLEKNYAKISLEHRGKYFNDHSGSMGKFPENFGTRIDPMKLIASVRESSEQLPIINERKFSDVLNDKERELAVARDHSLDATLVPDPSFDEPSTMNYAFRKEKSSEKIQSSQVA